MRIILIFPLKKCAIRNRDEHKKSCFVVPVEESLDSHEQKTKMR